MLRIDHVLDAIRHAVGNERSRGPRRPLRRRHRDVRVGRGPRCGRGGLQPAPRVRTTATSPRPVPLAAAVAARTTRAPDHGRCAPARALRAGQARRGPGRRRPDQPGPCVLRGRHRVPARGVRHVRRRPPSTGGDRRGAHHPLAAPLARRGGRRRRASRPGHAAAVHPGRARCWPTAGAPRRRHGGRRRLGLLFLAETHDSTLEEAYRAEGGASAPGCFFPPSGVPLTVFVADDPERAWAEIGEYLLLDAASYAGWNAAAAAPRRSRRRRRWPSSPPRRAPTRS